MKNGNQRGRLDGRKSRPAHKLALGIPALLMMAAGSPAFAQNSLPQKVIDGMYVTLAEVRANSERVFDVLAGPQGAPIPKQRFVTAELPPEAVPEGGRRELLSQLFEQLDANGDDRLTREEWRSRIGRDLSVADANGDGRVSLKELANARENMSVGDALGMVF